MAAAFEMRLSGGTSNTSAAASLGGARSTAGGGLVPTALTANSLFDDVTSTEEGAGDTEYRAVYLLNSGNQPAENVRIFLTDTTDPGTTFAIALDGAGVNGVAEGPVANENTAPTGEVFSSPTTDGTGLNPANVPAGQAVPIWIRRVVTAATGASDDTFTISVAFDTAA